MATLPPFGETVSLLVLIGLLLAVARVLGTVTDRLGLTRVVGELGTGFVLGPSVFGQLVPSLFSELAPAISSPLLEELSVFGLVLLLTLAGLETNINLVRSHARDVVALGSAGLVTPFVMGIGLGLVIPATLLTGQAGRWVFTLFLATSLSISAIPVIVRIFIDLDLFDTPFGQRTVATAMYTDVVGWLLLSVVVGLARVGSLDLRAVATVVVVLLAVVFGAVFLGQRLINAVLAFLPDGDSWGHLLVVVAAAIGASALTHAVGIEPVIGAFLIGVLFARAGGLPERAQSLFERMTLGGFAPIFFGVAGLNADLGLLFDPIVAIIAVITLGIATAGKIGGVYAAASWLGYDQKEALGMGIGLNARGAIEIVIATVGLELGILSLRMYTVILVVAILTSAMTAPLLRRLLGDQSSAFFA